LALGKANVPRWLIFWKQGVDDLAIALLQLGNIGKPNCLL
jgi:hypothetical protein